MDKERFEQLVNQAMAAVEGAVSDPRGQIEATLYMAINEAIEGAAKRFETGRTTLKGDSAALAASTLRGYKLKATR
jgi:hypothetical protein